MDLPLSAMLVNFARKPSSKHVLSQSRDTLTKNINEENKEYAN